MILKLLRPVPPIFRVSSPFGFRVIDGKTEFHNGVDFAVPIGTEVFACEDGAAFRCGWQDEEEKDKGYGLRVWQEIQREEDGKRVRYYIWYGHLSNILIKEGDRIKKGQLIGLSGNTGRVKSSNGGNGAHLHISVRQLDQKEFSDIEWI